MGALGGRGSRASKRWFGVLLMLAIRPWFYSCCRIRRVFVVRGAAGTSKGPDESAPRDRPLAGRWVRVPDRDLGRVHRVRSGTTCRRRTRTSFSRSLASGGSPARTFAVPLCLALLVGMSMRARSRIFRRLWPSVSASWIGVQTVTRLVGDGRVHQWRPLAAHENEPRLASQLSR